jgi:hypothetical protein
VSIDVGNILPDLAVAVVLAALAYALSYLFPDMAGDLRVVIAGLIAIVGGLSWHHIISSRFRKEKAAKARIADLQSLLNEVIKIRGLAHHNSALVRDSHSIQDVVRLPVTAFETAFFSSESSLLDEGSDDLDEESVSVGTPGLRSVSEPLASVTAYLTEASSINALVDIYLGLVRGLSSVEKARRVDAINQIIDKSQRLSEILDQLEKHLRRKLGGKN